jgi:hypothetical protein
VLAQQNLETLLSSLVMSRIHLLSPVIVERLESRREREAIGSKLLAGGGHVRQQGGLHLP